MPVITLTTDLGTRDYYPGSVKGLILKHSPTITIIDISHEIEPFNISQAAFVLSNCYKNFPAATVHLVCVNPVENKNDRKLALRYGDYFFVGPDNGFFSLLLKEPPEEMVVLNDLPVNGQHKTPTRDFLAHYAARLAMGEPLSALGISTTQYEQKTVLQPAVQESVLRGSIIYIDHFSNVVVNIHKDLFEEARRGRRFTVFFNRSEEITQMSNNYHDVPEGERLCTFNSSGYLEIAINKGKASKLLGLKQGDTILIDFE